MVIVVVAIKSIDYSVIDGVLRAGSFDRLILLSTDTVAVDSSRINCKIIDCVNLSSNDLLDAALHDFFEWLDFIRIQFSSEANPKLSELRLLNQTILNFTKFSQKKSSKTPITNLFHYRAAIIKYRDQMDFDERCSVSKILAFSGGDYFAVIENSILESFPNASLLHHSVESTTRRDNMVRSSIKFLNRLRRAIVTLGEIKRLNRLFGKKLMGHATSDRKVLLTTDDLWHLSCKDGVVESDYWPELVPEMKKRQLDIEWGVFIDPCDIEKTDQSLREAVYLSLAKQYSPETSVTALTLQSLKLFQAYISSFNIVKDIFQKGDEKFGLNLSAIAIDDLNSVVINAPSLLSLQARIISLVKNVGPLCVMERKPFNTFGKIVAVSSRELAKVIGIQHGVVNDSQLGYRFTKTEVDPCLDSSSYYLLPDKMLVFGRRVRDILLNSGFPQERVSIVGNLKYASKFAKLDSNIGSLNGRNINSILLALQSGIPETIRISALVSQALKTFGSLRVIIRAHPNHKGLAAKASRTIELNGVSKDRISISDSRNVFTDVTTVDCVICHSSTLIFDALISGTPVILMSGASEENDNRLFVDSGGFRVFSNAQELIEILSSTDHLVDELKCLELVKKNFATESSSFDILADQFQS